MVITIGTTFKGAIDDQQAINQILDNVKPSAVYRHLDAALFGGYLPFSRHAAIINRQRIQFDSIAVSGHKVFGLDEPAGIFITHRDTFSQQTPLPVAYLQDTVALLGCSRSALSPLKLWWKLQYNDVSDFQQQTEQMLNNAEWLKQALDAIHYPAWRNHASNIVYFRQPAPWIMEKWQLAPEQDSRLGGPLDHCVVMQHVSIALLEQFMDDLKSSLKSS